MTWEWRRILIFGGAGTGKTILAHQIGELSKVYQGRVTRIVNDPQSIAGGFRAIDPDDYGIITTGKTPTKDEKVLFDLVIEVRS